MDIQKKKDKKISLCMGISVDAERRKMPAQDAMLELDLPYGFQVFIRMALSLR